MKKILALIVKKRVLMGFVFAVSYVVLLTKGDIFFFSLGLAVVLTGELMRLWAASQLKKIQELSNDGIYSATRNPLYFGSFIIGLGFIIMSFSFDRFFTPVVFLAVYIPLFLYIYIKTIDNEEIALAEKFGEAYQEYKRNTPKFFPAKLPTGSGRIEPGRIIINGEYKTLMGILLIIAVLLIK